MKIKATLAIVTLAAAVGWMPTSSFAQSTDNWKFQATLEGFLPTIGGQSNFPGNQLVGGVSITPSDLIDKLKFVFVGSLQAQKGTWGIYTDVLYANIGGSKSQIGDFGIGGLPLPAGSFANATLDVKKTLWTLAGTYRLMDSPQSTLDLLYGARLIDARQTLNWQLGGNAAPPPGYPL